VAEAVWDDNDDVTAALAWLAQQPQVDPTRVGLVGSSYGAVHVVLAAGRGKPFKAGVCFGGPSISWPNVPSLQRLLLEAVRHTEVPLFFMQARNDMYLDPTYILGLEMAHLGKPHEARIYAPVGSEMMDGHLFFVTAISEWSADVKRFLDRWLVT
jgi:dienelactone hydrolase